MTDTRTLRELLAKATPPKEWQDGGDGILFGHSADDSGVWHAGDSTLACALVNAAPALLDDLDAAQKRIGELEGALAKVSTIRDSIVGRQAVNWSAHIYPLVAALTEAGYPGEGYEAARAKALDEQKALDAALAQARKEGRREGVEEAERACETGCDHAAAGCAHDEQRMADKRAIRALLPDSAAGSPVAARYQDEWDAMRANADAPESFPDTPPADWRPPWQEHKDVRPPLRRVPDSALDRARDFIAAETPEEKIAVLVRGLPSADAGPVAARWAARPVEERKALLADALSGEGITQGLLKGGEDAE